MITIKNKLITYCAIALFIYILYNDVYKGMQKEHSRAILERNNLSNINNGENDKSIILMDGDKKYEDYTFVEKIVYYFYKNEINAAMAVKNQKEMKKKSKKIQQNTHMNNDITKEDNSNAMEDNSGTKEDNDRVEK